MDETKLSTKDLSYIKDIFSWNINAYNLCCNFSSQISKEEEELIENLMSIHLELAQDCLALITFKEENADEE